ncbi:hypothetical protein ABKN59_005161 [Abortiporus biennis]
MEDSSQNPIVPLEPNSLYICLNQILVPGRYHWALYITGGISPSGTVAERHEWCEVRNRSSKDDPVEAYMHYKVNPVGEITERDFQFTLAVIKITAYVPPGPSASNTGDSESHFDFVDLFSNPPIFEESYSNWMINRKKGINCRVWVLKALERLRLNGLIVSLEREDIEAIEGKVTDVGHKATEKVASGEVKTVVTSL